MLAEIKKHSKGIWKAFEHQARYCGTHFKEARKSLYYFQSLTKSLVHYGAKTIWFIFCSGLFQRACQQQLKGKVFGLSIRFNLDPQKAISYGRVYKEEVTLERNGHVIPRRKITSLHTPPTEK